MNIHEIVAQWLATNKYDGLFADNCGCRLNDLMPCGEPGEDCEAGYARKTTPEEAAGGLHNAMFIICGEKEAQDETIKS